MTHASLFSLYKVITVIYTELVASPVLVSLRTAIFRTFIARTSLSVYLLDIFLYSFCHDAEFSWAFSCVVA